MLPDLSWPPERWREEAAKYAKKAANTTNATRREEYMERAKLYLSKAQRLEYDRVEVDQPLPDGR